MIPLKELLDRPYYATTAFSQAPLRWFSLAMSGGIPGRLRSRSLTAVLSFSLDRVSVKQSVGVRHGEEPKRKMRSE